MNKFVLQRLISLEQVPGAYEGRLGAIIAHSGTAPCEIATKRTEVVAGAVTIL